jgi:GGDEF domain-containing protein
MAARKAIAPKTAIVTADVVGRLSGEEFAAILPGNGNATAHFRPRRGDEQHHNLKILSIASHGLSDHAGVQEHHAEPQAPSVCQMDRIAWARAAARIVSGPIGQGRVQLYRSSNRDLRRARPVAVVGWEAASIRGLAERRRLCLTPSLTIQF